MGSLSQNILVVSERTPKYVDGSGDQKILYTSYYQMPNIHFCVINDRDKKTQALENWTCFFNIQEKSASLEKKWRYSDFISYFSTKHDRFPRSEKYLSCIVDQIWEIVVKKNIQLLVFEQTGILMWSWCRHFSSRIKCVLRVHDSHYHYLISDIRTRNKFLSKIAIAGSIPVQKNYEKKQIRQWDQIHFLSRKEYQYYSLEYPDMAEKLVYTPPSIFMAHNEYLLNGDKNTDILFVGDMGWKPNTDAAKWFLSYVLPHINFALPNVKVKIVGKNAIQKFKTRDKNVEVIGFVQSLDAEYKSAKLFINPSQSGGGIKVKLLHASAFGLPVVSTSDGIAGFKDNIRSCVVTRDKPSEFAKAVIELLRDDKLREEYSRKIYEYSNNEFNVQENQKLWETAVRRLL